MTLRQTLQKSIGNANQLFNRLLDTSNQAVKTRESVFAALSRELRLHLELEREHLFPVLRKHAQTKELVPDAVKANKDLLGAVDELEAMPKDDDVFLERVTGLRKLLQQHLRDERQELLPAVEKALTDDEAAAVASKIAAGTAQAQEAEHAAAEERRLAAKESRKSVYEIAGRKKALTDAVAAIADTAVEGGTSAVEAVKQGVRTAVATSQRALSGTTEAVTRGSSRIAQGANETLDSYRDMARESGQDVKAVGSALRTLVGTTSELGNVWIRSLARAGLNSLNTSFRLVRNPMKVVETQRDFVTEARRNLLETTHELLQITRRASVTAVRPVEERLVNP